MSAYDTLKERLWQSKIDIMTTDMLVPEEMGNSWLEYMEILREENKELMRDLDEHNEVIEENIQLERDVDRLKIQLKVSDEKIKELEGEE